MHFFNRHSEPVEEPVNEPVEAARPEPGQTEEEPPKRHGLFGSRRRSNPSPTPSGATAATNSTYKTSMTSHSATNEHNGGGIFRSSTEGGSGPRSLLRRSFGHGNDNSTMDPSIVHARERVTSAEAAEIDADRALEAARQSVREAHEHVRTLELEAKEEARLAKIKQHHAREVSKRGKQLGRHGL